MTTIRLHPSAPKSLHGGDAECYTLFIHCILQGLQFLELPCFVHGAILQLILTVGLRSVASIR